MEALGAQAGEGKRGEGGRDGSKASFFSNKKVTNILIKALIRSLFFFGIFYFFNSCCLICLFIYIFFFVSC